MSKDDAYWLRISYILFGCISAFTFYKMTQTVGIETGWIERYDEWYDYAALSVSIAFGFGITWTVSSNSERHEYFLASIGELRKVTWPNFPDTRRMTIIVCIVVGVFAVILAAFDFVWAKILSLMLA